MLRKTRYWVKIMFLFLFYLFMVVSTQLFISGQEPAELIGYHTSAG